MKINLFGLMLSLITLISCQDISDTNFAEIVGEYYNADSIDYTYLKIRSDSTFVLIQSPMYGDAMFYNYGFIKVENNRLKLYKGIDVTSSLEYNKIKDISSDTVIVLFDSSLFIRFPKLKVAIENDTDLPIKNYRILIKKPEYWNLQDEKYCCDNTYQYVPLYLVLRSGKYYAFIEYLFENREVKISTKKLQEKNFKNELLTEYLKTDSLLISKNESYEVIKNKLAKEKW